ncbi:SgcJ/EcaC family oxidoreductase [bacterium]|nr:SgcJ/EcaC family oxidoreductase [bacterium]
MKRIALGLLIAVGIGGPVWSQDAVSPPISANPPTSADATPKTDKPESPDKAKPAEEATSEEEKPEVSEPKLTEDELAVLAAVDSYVIAFNKADAKRLAEHWTEDGEFVLSSGEVLKGRAAIEESFATYFKETGNAKLELYDTQIKMISPRVAAETGMARVVGKDKIGEETAYEVIHVKTAAGWRIDSVKEAALAEPPPTHYERLKPLEWMIGTWVDNAEEGMTIETTGKWTTNQNFITRTFKVFIQDRVDFEGTQIVGWDPSVDAIRSWTFDSDGGFGVGRWSQNGNLWTVQALSVLPDGRRGSSTNIYEILDENTVQFKSIGRQVDGELQPNIETLTIIREE